MSGCAPVLALIEWLQATLRAPSNKGRKWSGKQANTTNNISLNTRKNSAGNPDIAAITRLEMLFHSFVLRLATSRLHEFQSRIC